ncbi:hypothetical protein BCY84_18416 [Trypanosoma cruzi cruzi]|nr:hypothetical protein BCY84_18416 [Trypanosoma cruzi cruzi]
MSESIYDVTRRMALGSGRGNTNVDLESINQESGSFVPAFFFSTGAIGDAENVSDDGYLERVFESLSMKPGRLDPEALPAMDDALQTNILDEAADVDFQYCCQQTLQEEQQEQEAGKREQQQLDQPHSSGQTDSFEGVSPLYETKPHSLEHADAYIKYPVPSTPFSTNSEMASESQTSEANVYTSITALPIQGRSLDFRGFLSKKQVASDILKENSVGVFVGQLPSTYSEEDTAALLRAIGADSGVSVHVRDVKSHNQSRTCAFVVVNRSALPVLLGYSKRVLCDVSCVWVVEREQAAHLKDYVNGFVRDRLRGVPKAALVLEELTPQYMRSRTSASKGGKSSNRHKGEVGAVPENFLIATNDVNSIITSHPLAMNFVVPGWNSMDTSALSFRPISNNTGVTPFLNNNPAPNIPGVLQNHILPTTLSPSVVAPVPQVNYYVIGAPPNGFQGLPPNQINTKVFSAPAVNGGGNGTGNGGLGNSGTSFPSSLSDFGASYNVVPPPPKLPEGVSRCSTCLSPIGAMEPVFLFPQDNTVMCMRCSNQRGACGDAAQATRGMTPFIVPQSNLGGSSHPPAGNPAMFLHTLPPYTSQSHSQNPLIPQIPQQPLPPPPLAQQQQGYSVNNGWQYV